MKYGDMCYLVQNDKSFMDCLIKDNGWSETDLIKISSDNNDSMVWMDGKLYDSSISVLGYLALSENQQERMIAFLKKQREIHIDLWDSISGLALLLYSI